MALFRKKAAADPATPPRRQPGCCASCSRAVCSGILATTFLSICALSIAALVGIGSYWTYYTHNSSDPGAYYITSGWLHFRTRDITPASLSTVNYGLWIIGAISAAALLLSAILSAVEFLLAVMNKCGRHTAGLAFPTGIILFGILICYIAAAVIEFRVYTFNDTGSTFNVWPSWGWIVAIIAAVLWFLAAVCASCMGPRAPPPTPLPEYQQPAYQQPAPGAYPGAGAAAAPPPKRGWFGRRQAVPTTTGPAANEQYTAQPFNQATTPGRDVEMGSAGAKHNGHAGEAAAAGIAGGAAAGTLEHRRNEPTTSPPGPLGTGAQPDAPPKRRSLFGRNRSSSTGGSAGGPNNVAGGARQRVQTPASAGPMQHQGLPVSSAADGGTGMGSAADGIGTPNQAAGGAWAGSRLASDDAEAPRGAWAGTGHRDTDLATADEAPMTDVPLHNDLPPAPAAARPAPAKKGIFSFYH